MDFTPHSNQLKFGVDLSQVYKTNGYHPALDAMFDLLEEKAENIDCSIFQDFEIHDSRYMKKIKKLLNDGYDVSFQKYPPLIVLGVLRSFLKYLPEPLLHRDLYREWMILGRMLQQAVCYSLQKIALLNVRIMRLLDEQLRFEEYLLLRRVIFTLRSLALEKSDRSEVFNTPKLNFLTRSFASVLIRRRVNSNSNKNPKPSVQAVIVVNYLIVQAPHVFGEVSRV